MKINIPLFQCKHFSKPLRVRFSHNYLIFNIGFFTLIRLKKIVNNFQFTIIIYRAASTILHCLSFNSRLNLVNFRNRTFTVSSISSISIDQKLPVLYRSHSLSHCSFSSQTSSIAVKSYNFVLNIITTINTTIFLRI